MLKAALEVQPELAMAATPSSSTAGFFQAVPSLPPQYTSPDGDTTSRDDDDPKAPASPSVSDDKVLERILDLYLPQNRRVVTSHLHRIARLALDPRVLAHAVDAETNPPVLRGLTPFGEENRNDPLWTTAAWRRLKEIEHAEGLVTVAYSRADETAHLNRRVYQFALAHLWGVTGAMTGCPLSMTDGAATLLASHLKDPDADQLGRARVFEEAYRRLTSRDPKYVWTSGQWMIERSGGSDGSDVSATEPLATRLTAEELARDAAAGRDEDAVGMPLGPWRLSGSKWFSSAPDADMAIVLARTSSAVGLSAFYMPLRRRRGSPPDPSSSFPPAETQLNGVRPQRFKTKLGTRALPTAELSLHSARAWLIGAEGHGVAELSTVLNITRLHAAAASVASWARGLAICRAYSRVRRVHGGLLADNALHLRWMAGETVQYTAAAHFAFLGVALQGALEQAPGCSAAAATPASRLLPSSKEDAALLLRLLLPALLPAVSLASVAGLRACTECLGGVGYCENNEFGGGLLNLTHLFRDTLATPSWEGGTVSAMAQDVVHILTDPQLNNNHDILGIVFVPWVSRVLAAVDPLLFKQEIDSVTARLARLEGLVRGKGREELLYQGRVVLRALEEIACGAVLLFDASVRPGCVAREVARRYVSAGGGEDDGGVEWRDAVRVDKSIFLGTAGVGGPLEKL